MLLSARNDPVIMFQVVDSTGHIKREDWPDKQMS